VNGIFFKEQTQALLASGIDAHVVVVEGHSLRQFSLSALANRHFQKSEGIEDGILTVRQHGWGLRGRTLAWGWFWSRLTVHLARAYMTKYGKPDLIHAHNAIWAGRAARTIKALLDVPFVVTEHSTAVLKRECTPSQIDVCRQTYGNAEQVITVGTALRERVLELRPGIDVRLVPNVIQTDYFSLPPAPRQRRPFAFVSVGHLVDRKGFDILLRAFAQAFRGRSGVQLRIGGDGPERPRLAALISALRIQDQVTLLGALTREQVRAAMWGGNAFVLASRAETFGVVYAEALSTGIPIIATDSGGPTDIVTPGVGSLVPKDDVDQLAAAMRDWAEREVDASAIRRSAEGRFSVRVITAQLSDIYAEVSARTAK